MALRLLADGFVGFTFGEGMVMGKRVFSRVKSPRKRTSEFSSVSDGGMFESRPFVVQSKVGEEGEKSELKTSLMRAERYGHQLNQMYAARNSLPIQNSTSTSQTQAIQCSKKRKSSTTTATKKTKKRRIDEGNSSTNTSQHSNPAPTTERRHSFDATLSTPSNRSQTERRHSFDATTFKPENIARIRERSANQPIPAHPQINFMDNNLRQVHSFNFPLTGQPQVQTPFATYHVLNRRNQTEQSSSSHPLNAFAPTDSPRVHGSHSGQHSRGGEPSRFNMTPVSEFTNSRGGSISQFETEQRNLAPNFTGQTIRLGQRNQTQYQAQHTMTTYNQANTLPRLISQHSLNTLQNGSNDQRAMAASIKEQAQQIPFTQDRVMYNPGAAPSTLSLGQNQILDRIGTTGSPRYPDHHITENPATAAFIRGQRPTGRPDQFRTTETQVSAMNNQLLFHDFLRTLPETHPVRSSVRTAYGVRNPRTHQRYFLTDRQARERVQNTATENLRSFTTHRNDNQTVEQGRDFLSRFGNPDDYGRGQRRRNNQ